MITSQQYQQAALSLNVPIRIIKTVAGVESSGVGFYRDGRLVLLFEPHIFYKQLKTKGIDPAKYMQDKRYKDIVYPKWGTLPYPHVSSDNWERVTRAAAINKEAAYNSASWGMFQAMGFNHQVCGFDSATAMVEAYQKSEYEQLAGFVSMIKAWKLDGALRGMKWAAFAAAYNGPGYDDAPGRLHDYDYRLEQFYKNVAV